MDSPTPTLERAARAASGELALSRQFGFADLKIRTKDKRIVTFEPNAVQAQYLDIILPDWREGNLKMRGLREDDLKARQFGFSTLILALMFLDTINTPNTQTVVIAHDSESTERLFQMVQRFYKHLPEAERPRTKYANRREFLWPDLDSYFFVGTAGNGEFGRGGTINNVHASEVAFWPDGETIMAGLMQAVPRDGNVFQESTAKGVGTYFYDEYQRAVQGESAFTARFFPWFAHPEYATDPPPTFELEHGTMVANALGQQEYKPSVEEVLRERHGVTDAQLQWRRLKLKEPGMSKKFVQEYPANDREAFISSGNPYFDNEKLENLAEQLKDPAFNPIPYVVPDKYATLKREARGGGATGSEEERRKAGEELLIWALPKEGHVYAFGADTALGLNGYGDHDYDADMVWDVTDNVQVAELHGRWDTHTYGVMLAELGFWYNTALLGVERNQHGFAVINAALYTANYPEAMHDNSTGLYMHQEFDEKKTPTTRRAGFPTTRDSKTFILDELATSVEEGSFHPRSRALVSDMMRFVKLPNGKAGGEGRAHDDRVMAMAVTTRMKNLRPRAQKTTMSSDVASSILGSL